MRFYRLAIGARFTAHGRRFTKCGMAAAEDERGLGYTFPGIVNVEPEGVPLLLPPEEAEKRKPSYGPWQELMERAYGPETGAEGL